jgi:hypothetical protein
LLTFRFQTELGMNAHPIVSDTRQDAASKHTTVSDVHPNSSNAVIIVPDIRRDISNTNPIVPGIWSDVKNTPTIVSDVNRDKLKGREGVGGQNQAVSTTRALPVTK